MTDIKLREFYFGTSTLNFLKNLDKDASEPFKDASFVTANEHLIYVEHMMDWVKREFHAVYLKNDQHQQTIERTNGVLRMLTSTFDQIQSYINKRLDLTPEKSKPRIVRMCKELELTPKESKAVMLVLAAQCATDLAQFENNNVGPLAKFCGMDASEMLKFTDEQRNHIKQNLIQIDVSYRDALTSSVLKMPKEVMTALCGFTLSAEEFLKIDNTALSKVILEEEGSTGYTESAQQSSDLTNDRQQQQMTIDQELASLEEQLSDTNLTQEEEGEFDLYAYMKNEKANGNQDEASATKMEELDPSALQPYENDIDYLDDGFQYISTLIRIRKLEVEKDDPDRNLNSGERAAAFAKIRELQAKQRMLKAKCEKRIQITIDNKGFVPRLERLARIRNLTPFDQKILLCLVGFIISHDMTVALGNDQFRSWHNNITVGSLLFVLCSNLKSRISHRKHFYKKSCLVRDGMVYVDEKSTNDLFDCGVSVDRRMMDYITGLDCELDELVQGSRLYKSNVTVDQVILPDDKKQLIMDSTTHYQHLKMIRNRLGYHSDEHTSGGGLILLFFGESGTGKTMMANALSNHLHKKILTVNYSVATQGSNILRFVFRESKINDALLFLDECEGFFESRDKRLNPDVTGFLAEIDKHDGLIIMATNRAFDLDQAMHRRITLAVEFTAPDVVSRMNIWREQLPLKVDSSWLSKQVDIERLAMDYELTGGLIKNAAMQALGFAVARDSQNVLVSQSDLERAARLQLKGIAQSNEFDRRIIPKRSLNDLVLDEDLLKRLKDVIEYDKVKNVLYGRWGFADSKKGGTSVLISGPPGSGKSMCAEVLGYELGSALKVVDVMSIISQYTFNTSKNIETLFKEAKKTGAIIVMEMSTGNMSKSSDSKLDQSITNLLYNIEHYDGVIVLITDANSVDDMLLSRFRFVIQLKQPDELQRVKLWRSCIPNQVPLDGDVDFKKLAKTFHRFSGGAIYSAAFRACCKAVLDRRDLVNMNMLVEAAEMEQENQETNQWKTNAIKYIYS
ncbi:AAA family ATPase [Acrasis kona]|uniref:AAA family ATPase n=1 Tax=Acrasis kona TaxID=1008807 RepID=A0AAW2Z452_9EUKA